MNRLASLAEHEQDLVAKACDFARRVVAPQAESWEAEGTGLPAAVIREYATLGFAALQVSPARGGLGASYRCKLLVAEAIAAECFPTAFALNNLQGAVTRIDREGTPDQVERYLPGLMAGSIIGAPSLSEPGAGSDLGALRTMATRVPGGWRLTGEKAWITNGAIAHHLVLYAQTQPGAGWQGIASFIVNLDAPGIERLPPEPLIGGGAIGACGIRLTAAFVPDADLFAPAGEAFKRGLRGITGARIHVAAMINATVAAALRLALRHAGTRQAFGKPLLAHQGFRWQLVDVAAALEASRLLVERAAGLVEAGAEAQIEAAFAKKHAAEMATPAIAACMQALGAGGLRRAHPLGRHLAAARIAAYVDGTTEMMNERIGASLRARYGDG
jgi:alkylation response protein AidB-like acyl-CoA dehydrogenase